MVNTEIRPIAFIFAKDGVREQDHHQGKEMQKAKWLSEEALQIAEKRRQAKDKGESKAIPIWMQSSKE